MSPSNKDWEIINRDKLAMLLSIKKDPKMLDYEIKRLKQIMDEDEFNKVKRESDTE